MHNEIEKWRSKKWTLSWYQWITDTSNASTWWTVKETEVNSYSIKDWDSANCWNDEKKLLNFYLSSHKELEWFMHHLHSVDDDETKSSQDCFAKAKTFNVFEEVSWQNYKKT